MMQHNGSRACEPEVITLSDSDDEVLIAPTSSVATASVSILHERPLSPSAFLAPPIQHTPLTNSTFFVNSDPNYGLEANRINGRVSHIRTSKRHSNDLDQAVPVKRFLDERTLRTPLQQTAQFDPAWGPSSRLTVVTPSNSCAGSRQSNVNQGGINGTIALKRHSTPINILNSNISSVPYLSSHYLPQAGALPISSTPHTSSTRQTSRQSQQVVQQDLNLSRQVRLAAEQIRQRLYHQPQSRYSSSASMSAENIRSIVPQPQLISRSRTTPHQETTLQRRQMHTSSASQSRAIKLLSSCYYESRSPRGPAVEPLTCTAKFKCSYGRCSKLLPCNVSMMFHVWSHLVYDSQNSFTDDDENGSEVVCSVTCGQCLLKLPYPHAMQTHFNSVHNNNPHQSTCRICELVVDPVNHTVHGYDDAPYHCKKCRYRTSMRSDLLDHFVREHSDSRSLLCPFCLTTFAISQSQCYDAVVFANTFVDHMIQHKTGENIRCRRCALMFVREADRKMHDQKDHTRKNPKWKSRSVFDAQIRMVDYMDHKVHLISNEHTCVECGEEMQDVQEHTRQVRTCARCNYQTACDEAYMHHKGVKCNVSRIGIVRSRLLRTIVECAGCGRKSADAQTMFPHLAQCSGGTAIIREVEQGPIDEADSANERVEAEYFGLCRPKEEQDKSETMTKKMRDREREAPAEINKITEFLQHDFDKDGQLEKAEQDVHLDTESMTARLKDILEMLADATLKDEGTGTETSS